MSKVSGVLSAVVVILAAQVASADEITFTGTDGFRSAEVKFETSGSNLIVTLTNTGSYDAMVPNQILSGVYFSAPVTLTTVSATAALGSVYLFPLVTNVGGEWAYKSGINGPGASTQGISAVGMGAFGPGDKFPGPNIQGQNAIGGLNFSIAPTGDNPATGNGGLAGRALIQDSVTFVLSGWSGSLASITDVYFQYGTSFNEPHFGGTSEKTPEPASMVLLGIGAAGLLAARRRKNAKA